MEPSQTPPPGGSATPPPGGGRSDSEAAPPPPAEAVAPTGGDGKAGIGLRIGALALALVLAVVCAVAVAVMVDVNDTGTCDDVDVSQVSGTYDCYDFSSSIKPLVLGAGWLGAILTGAAAILALAFTIGGRGGRLLLMVVGAAAVLLAVSILAAQL